MGLLLGLAGITFGLALGTLTIFFATKDARFDRVSEWSWVAFAVVALPPMFALPAHLPDGALVQLATALGVAGVAVLGLAELGLGLQLLDFRRIAVIVSLGFVAFLAWMAGISVAIVGGATFSATLGWLGIGSIAMGLAVMAYMALTPGVLTGKREPAPAQMGAFLVPALGVVAWLAWLGLSL